MKLREIKVIAKAKGIDARNLKKAELIREIQKSEGNFDCFGSAISGFCDRADCVLREDCLGNES